MSFQGLGPISNIEAIAVGRSIRELSRLERVYGSGRWRKLKGRATVQFDDKSLCRASALV